MKRLQSLNLMAIQYPNHLLTLAYLNRDVEVSTSLLDSAPQEESLVLPAIETDTGTGLAEFELPALPELGEEPAQTELEVVGPEAPNEQETAQ